METDQPGNEALAWLERIYQHGKSTPKASLFSYFRGQTKQEDLTLPVVNLVTASCKTVFGSTSSGNSNSNSQAQLDPGGSASYLYYMVAQGLLQQLFPRDAQETATAGDGGSQRFKGMLKVTNPPQCTALVSCQEFHLPLIECALTLVHHTISSSSNTASQQQETPDFLSVSQLLQREDRAALLWQAARSFLEFFSPTSPCPMPQQLQSFLHHLQEQLLQEPVFRSHSVLYELMTAGGGCQFQQGDMTLAHDITAAYAAQGIHQTQAVAWLLQQARDDSGSQLSPNFHEECSWLMDQVVLRHLDVCFGVHQAVVVACVVYVTAKVTQAALPFSTITQAVSSCLHSAPSHLFTDTELAVQPLQCGDLRAFYNSRFLPAVQADVRSYLQQYSDWRHTQQPTIPAPASATALHHTSAAINSTTHTLEASQPMHSYAPPATRTPFNTIKPGLPSVTLQGKPVAGRRPPPKVVTAASGDQENAAVGGSAHSLFGPQQNRLQGGTVSGVSPMQMR